jgi:hypothetical protein
LVAALTLTGLLQSFPAIAQIDERLLQFFKMLGNIPLEAIIQSEQLYRSGTGVPTRMRAELRAHVRNRLELGVFNDLAEEYAHLPSRRWASIAYTRSARR